MAVKKAYIGDGVYAEYGEEGFGEIILTTENGIETTNTIILEPEVWFLLVQQVEAWRKPQAAGGVSVEP